jgi:hypothetical protein
MDNLLCKFQSIDSIIVPAILQKLINNNIKIENLKSNNRKEFLFHQNINLNI